MFKKLALKVLLSPSIVAKGIRLAAGQSAAAIVAMLAQAPGWVQNLVTYLSERLDFEVNEASITVLVGLAITEAIEYFAGRIQGEEIKRVQAASGALQDGWIHTETGKAVERLARKVDEYKANWDRATGEAIRLRKVIAGVPQPKAPNETEPS